MQQNGVVGVSSLQIEIIVVGPPDRLPITCALSLPFSTVIAINKLTTSHPYIIQSKSRRTRRWWWDRMSPRSFKGDEFWEGGDEGEDDDEGGKWKRWRRRRRQYPEKWTSLDAFWIFRPYGGSLPLILLSWLAASGPKAFFFSLVLFIALSSAAMVVQFLWRGSRIDFQGGDSKRVSRSARRVSRRGVTEGLNDETRNGRKRASGYYSWLDEPSFSGWVEWEEKFPDESGQVTGKQRGKGSRESLQDAEAETPLLLRLLVTMFPFVASWTKLFW